MGTVRSLVNVAERMGPLRFGEAPPTGGRRASGLRTTCERLTSSGGAAVVVRAPQFSAGGGPATLSTGSCDGTKRVRATPRVRHALAGGEALTRLRDRSIRCQL